VTALVLDLLTANAARLARDGDYDGAERLLSSLSGPVQNSAFSLDLLAKIRAQRGDFSGAHDLWNRAQLLSPGNAEYRKALERIRKVRRRPSWYTYGKFFALSCFLLLLVGMTIAFLKVSGKARLFTRSTPEKSQSAEITLATSPTSIKPTPTNLELEVDGVTARSIGNDTTLTFNSGLFSRSIRFQPGATDTLAAVAKKLSHLPNGSMVQIIGLADDLVPATRRHFDNPTLALRRALMVAEYFRRNSNLSPRMISIRYPDLTQLPFPNDSLENRMRNRSVVIRISQAPN